MSKIAFLGAGNHGFGHGRRACWPKAARRPDFICLSGSGRTATALSARTGIGQATSLAQLLTEADTLVVAFKPQHLASPIHVSPSSPRASSWSQSWRASGSLPWPARFRAPATSCARCPTRPRQIGAGITPWCARDPLSTPQTKPPSKTLFGALWPAPRSRCEERHGRRHRAERQRWARLRL
jgi:pyrroline-5-carboxylate reductase